MTPRDLRMARNALNRGEPLDVVAHRFGVTVLRLALELQRATHAGTT